MKLVLVALVILAVVIGRRMYVAARTRRPAPLPPLRVPSEVVPAGGGWVVFATRRDDRRLAERLGGRVLDPAREPHLAEGLRVRSTPVAFRCDPSGRVASRLDGAVAIRRYVEERSATA